MSRVTEQLDRIEAKIIAENNKDEIQMGRDKETLEYVKLAVKAIGDDLVEIRKDMRKQTECLKDTNHQAKVRYDEIVDRLDCMTDCDLCDIIDEQDEVIVNQEETIDRHLDHIHYLSDQLNELAEENAKLRKKNKRLKKKVKRLSAYIDEMETAE